MAVYSQTEKQSILDSVTITGILRYFGKSYRVNRSGLCLSPFRDERTPSFHISADDGAWIDFGTGDNGGKVSLVCLLSNCKASDAYDLLANISRTFIPEREAEETRQRIERSKEYVTVIDSVKEITSAALIDYAASRGIDESVLKKYCKEVRYHVGTLPSPGPVIGFKNMNGGWVFRGPKVKKCSKSGITFSSTRVDGHVPRRLCVYEGLFDFLSHVQQLKDYTDDYLVLNSVTNVRSSLPFMKEYAVLDLYLDNDAAGRNTVAIIEHEFPEKKIIDNSFLLGSFKDLNEKHMHDIHNSNQWKHQYLKK